MTTCRCCLTQYSRIDAILVRSSEEFVEEAGAQPCHVTNSIPDTHYFGPQVVSTKCGDTDNCDYPWATIYGVNCTTCCVHLAAVACRCGR